MRGTTILARWAVRLSSAVLLFTASAEAQGLVEYRFSGVVTDNTGNLGIFGLPSSVTLGQSFTGRFSYLTGPGNPDQLPADVERGLYNLVDFQLDQAIVAITPGALLITHRAGLPTLDPLPPDPGLDRFSVVGTFPFDDGFKPVTLSLSGPFESVFTDDSLPASITLGDFPDAKIVQSIRVIGLAPDGQSLIDEGDLVTLSRVPEPDALLLALLSLLAATLMSRRGL